jgi:large repetitive protein
VRGFALARRGVRAASRRRSSTSPASFRTSAVGNDGDTGNPSTCVITVPGSVATGDVLVLIATQNTGSNTFSPAGGGTGVTWTTDKGPNTSSGNNMRTYVWTADATSTSKGSTITITSTSGARFPGLLLVLTGVTRTGRIVSDPAYKNSATTSHTFPTVTVATTGSLLVGVISLRSGAPKPAAELTAPSGSTQRGESETATTTSPNMTVTGVVVDSTVASGSRTPGTGTSTLIATSIAYTLAFAPA